MNLRSALVASSILLSFAHIPARATWSVLAIDRDSGQMVVSAATCLKQEMFPRIGAKDLRDIHAIVVQGKGIAVAQSFIDLTRKNQNLIAQSLEGGIEPSQIIQKLMREDTAIQTRQFAVLNMQGNSASFNGAANWPVAMSQGGVVSKSIHYQIQGNLLANQAVIQEAVKAFERTTGHLTDRVMAAMEAADAKGGDKRCTDGRTAYVSYLLVVDKAGKETYISVTDNESLNPIIGLRRAYEKSDWGSARSR